MSGAERESAESDRQSGESDASEWQKTAWLIGVTPFFPKNKKRGSKMPKFRTVDRGYPDF
jgi:hypothetical protein